MADHRSVASEEDVEYRLFLTDLAAVNFRVSAAEFTTSAYRRSSQCQRDDRGRIKVFMLGSRFVPMQQVMYRIRRMIRKNGSWINWDEFSGQRKDRLFDEFKWHFFWDKNIDERVYNQWEARASGYLDEVLSKAKFSGEKPDWISDKNWSIMLNKWKKIGDDDEINKRDCVSGFGLKRSSSSMKEEELRKAKSQKTDEESSTKIAPETIDASFHGENIAAEDRTNEPREEMELQEQKLNELQQIKLKSMKMQQDLMQIIEFVIMSQVFAK